MSLQAFLAAVEARSPDGVRAALSPAFAGKANGRALDGEGLVRLLESFWAGFPDGAFKVEATGGSGHHVLTWTFAGTHGGVYLGVPPTGSPVTLSGFTVAISNATGLVSMDWKWDTKAFASQVLGPEDLEGALPTGPGHRPDPSVRWAREAQRRHGGGRKGGKGPKGGQDGKGRTGGKRKAKSPSQGNQPDASPPSPSDSEAPTGGTPEATQAPTEQAPQEPAAAPTGAPPTPTEQEPAVPPQTDSATP